MGKIYQGELAALLVEKCELEQKKAQHFVTAFVKAIQLGLEADRMVKIRGFGTFKVVDVGSRESINVNTGERVVIEGHSKLTFLPDNAMKDLVNRPFSQFDTVILNDGVDFSDLDSAEVEEEQVLPSEEEVVLSPEEDLASPSDEEPVSSSEEEQGPTSEEEAAPSLEEENPSELLDKMEAIPTDSSDESEEKPEISPDETDETPEISPDESEDINIPVSVEEVVSVKPSATLTEPTTPTIPTEPTSSTESFAILEAPLPSPERNWRKYLLVSVIALALGFGGGYLVGRQSLAVPVAQEEKAPIPKQETTAQQAVVVADAPLVQEEPVETPSAQPSQDAPTSEEPIWEKYNNMDRRTHDGFYYIMGLDRVEKARQGDTPGRIAKRVFGASEMACYIEVFNGFDGQTILEEGTEVRIPKVEPKKTVRKRLQQQQNNQ